MVGVQVRDEYLGQKIRGDHQRINVGVGSGTDVEQELLSVAQFHQEASGRLAAPSRWHAGPTSDDSDFVRLQWFRAWIVNVAIRRSAGRCFDFTSGSVRLRKRLWKIIEVLSDGESDAKHDQKAGCGSSTLVHLVVPLIGSLCGKFLPQNTRWFLAW